MSSRFIIQGQASLKGAIPVFGSKNAALPLMAAALLSAEEVTLANIPTISDAASMQTLLSSIGAAVDQEDTTVTIRAREVNTEAIAGHLVGTLRGSILLLGALLGRAKHARLPLPGGDIIGARPIHAHIDAFTQLGARVNQTDSLVTIDGQSMKAGRVVMPEFSVTATENVLLAAAALPGTTTIELAAAEPHVAALAQLLTAMGASVEGAGTHTIRITGTETLRGVQFTNIPDMLEAGLFILLAAATTSQLEITNVPVEDLLLFFKKLDEIGIRYEIEAEQSAVKVFPSKLKAFRLQTLPHPGLATDLQAPFAVIATQAAGSSLIHDPLYEGRFKHIAELQKMGADAIVCDPHRVIINGPTKLTGRRIPSLDIRAGATLIMAGLVAQGQTIIDNAEIIDRGYAHLEEKLIGLGAKIWREKMSEEELEQVKG
jgi:UDP-N-acetylglucosamine 1-carboxyvinyltransferase